jgi:hypothetical protein
MTDADIKGYMFDYVPGQIEVRFEHEDSFDYLRMHIRMRTGQTTTTPVDHDFAKGQPAASGGDVQVLSCRISSLWCPFHALIRWLEAVTTGVQECAYEWDAEAEDGRMEWRRRADETGFVTVKWPWHYDAAEGLRVMVVRKQMVAAFYQAFRSFVESPAYDPLRYERLSIGDAALLILNDLVSMQDLIDRLLPLTAHRAKQVMNGICGFASERHRGSGGDKLKGRSAFTSTWDDCWRESEIIEIKPPDDGRISPYYIAEEWDSWGKTQRSKDLEILFQRDQSCGGDGAPLRNLRSTLLETWLADSSA